MFGLRLAREAMFPHVVPSRLVEVDGPFLAQLDVDQSSKE
jgi:hypothetical protein